jgi:hypothetical protein
MTSRNFLCVLGRSEMVIIACSVAPVRSILSSAQLAHLNKKKADLSEPTEPNVDNQQLPAEPEVSRSEPK